MRVVKNAYFILSIVAVMFGIEIINTLLNHKLNAWGLYPRTASGVVGIFASPFLHTGFVHLFFNMLPFAVLSWIIALRGKSTLISVFIFVMLVEGALLWCFGRNAYHVGASGIVLGLFGYIIGRGFVERSVQAITISAVTFLVYGGLLWGIFPTALSVSWEGHLFGLIAGALASKFFTHRPERLD